jgi:hypothetical protein
LAHETSRSRLGEKTTSRTAAHGRTAPSSRRTTCICVTQPVAGSRRPKVERRKHLT